MRCGLRASLARRSEVVSRLDVLIKDQKARMHGLETAVAAATTIDLGRVAEQAPGSRTPER
jgi:hypothetical protein